MLNESKYHHGILSRECEGPFLACMQKYAYVGMVTAQSNSYNVIKTINIVANERLLHQFYQTKNETQNNNEIKSITIICNLTNLCMKFKAIKYYIL